MKRGEFLKRLGLGAVAAVAAPALLKSEDKAVELKPVCSNSVGQAKKLAFWRQSDKCIISSAFTIDIPPLKEGEYKYELTVDDKQILSGNIISA